MALRQVHREGQDVGTLLQYGQVPVQTLRAQRRERSATRQLAILYRASLLHHLNYHTGQARVYAHELLLAVGRSKGPDVTRGDLR